MSDTIELNTHGLDQLIKAMKMKMPVSRVGILGDENNRQNAAVGQTNASIGAVHEFGSSKMPQRSFLRAPISDHLQKEMEESGALDKAVLKEVIQSGSILPWMKEIVILAEAIVIKAFATGGFGKWPKWKNPAYTNNANQILKDTRQLSESITSECK